MARHPAHIMASLTVRVPRGYQGFWEIVRELHRQKQRWTFLEVSERCNVANETVNDYLHRLAKAGYIKKDGATAKATLYRLVKDQPEAPRLLRDGTAACRQGLGQDHLWRAMKMLSTFNARELHKHATTAEVAVSLAAAKRYIASLHRAGYLIEIVPAKPGHRPGTGRLATYRLSPAMNTGPLAPQIQATKFVWDPNTKKVMGPAEDARGAA